MPGWRHPGDADPPARIVALVHAEIAAQGPEEAALVAEYEELKAAGLLACPTGPEALRIDRDERVAEYSRHRDRGVGSEEAAALVGVGVHTARKYERSYQGRRAAG